MYPFRRFFTYLCIYLEYVPALRSTYWIVFSYVEVGIDSARVGRAGR